MGKQFDKSNIAEVIPSIKLIIWDLDETFWKGILSENSVEFIKENADLIRNMADCGVISSICSKNDYDTVKDYLTEKGIWDLFVFSSINWDPKGPRVRQLISDIQLRAPNVLFIDDNHTNRGEVAAFCKEINVADVDVIPELIRYFSSCPRKDPEHQRLKQYHVLEEKTEFKGSCESNEQFLRECHIRAEIKYDCLEHLERIADLVARSNQLNFTKWRQNQEELQAFLQEKDVKSGYVEVKDDFGDYGIVGFFAVQDHLCRHFVFSCRVLGMGIEQYVYKVLQLPEIHIEGAVSSDLMGTVPDWINQKDSAEPAPETRMSSIQEKRILINGPCDLSSYFSYIRHTDNIRTEFTYINDRGISIEGITHLVHIIESQTLSRETKDRMAGLLPFGDRDMFQSAVLSSDSDILVISMLENPNLGLYREKQSGALVAFGTYVDDLTDESIWQDLIHNRRYTANCRFTEENLRSIQEHFEYAGRLTPDQILTCLDYLYQHIQKSQVLVISLGSEMPCDASRDMPGYTDRHLYHREMNQKIRNWAEEKENVRILDVNRFLKGQEDFRDQINHYTRQIEYQMAMALIDIINSSQPDQKEILQRNDRLASSWDILSNKIRRAVRKLWHR